MGGSTKTKTKNTTTLNPWAQQQYETISAPILEYANSPVAHYGGELSTGADPMQQQAAGMAQANIGAGQGTLGSAIDLAGASAAYSPQTVNAGQLAGMDYSAYMNPYLDSVAGSYLDNLDTMRQRALVGNSQAAGAGAWGGSRHGVADALTNEAALKEASSGLNSIYSQGFNQAQQAGQFDINAAMQADLANQNAGMAGAQLGLQGAGLLGQFGAQQQAMGQSDASFLNQFGAQQQGYDQAALDRAYQQFLAEQQQGLAQQGLALGVLGSTPFPTNSTGTQKNTSSTGLGQVLGTGLQVAGMFMSDARRKKDVEHVLTDGKGRRWYDFRYDYEDADEPKHRGVMAQEVALTDPHAVSVRPDGWLQVDYGALA